MADVRFHRDLFIRIYPTHKHLHYYSSPIACQLMIAALDQSQQGDRLL